jgi:hypothetical protein
MITNTISLANWGMGTALIIFFAVLCIVLSAIVISFVMGSKMKKDGDSVASEEEKL